DRRIDARIRQWPHRVARAIAEFRPELSIAWRVSPAIRWGRWPRRVTERPFVRRTAMLRDRFGGPSRRHPDRHFRHAAADRVGLDQDITLTGCGVGTSRRRIAGATQQDGPPQPRPGSEL